MSQISKKGKCKCLWQKTTDVTSQTRRFCSPLKLWVFGNARQTGALLFKSAKVLFSLTDFSAPPNLIGRIVAVMTCAKNHSFFSPSWLSLRNRGSFSTTGQNRQTLWEVFSQICSQFWAESCSVTNTHTHLTFTDPEEANRGCVLFTSNIHH